MNRRLGGVGLLFCLLALVAGEAAADAPNLEPALLFSTPEWKREDHRAALDAFLAACRSRTRPRAIAFRLGRAMRTVDAAAWQRACSAGTRTGRDKAAAKAFFEREFTTYRLGEPGKGILVTGYYLPLLRATRQRSGMYRYPIYGLPSELAADPKSLFFSRSAIDAGALDGRKLELLWTNDPVMRFFLQVQGSGYAMLPGGKKVQLLYAGKNNQPYVAIGKQLIAEGEIPKNQVSMQGIRDWLYAHPARQEELMQINPSYVFFRLNETPKPVIGAAGTPLSPKRNLAVDPAFYPYRMPIFLRFASGGTKTAQTMIAADAGSAILGPSRADVYFGEGQAAETAAGGLKANADAILLLPRAPRHGD